MTANFAHAILKLIFLCENCWILIKISLESVTIGALNNNPALFQIMACRRSATSHYLNQWRPSTLVYTGVSRSQWVKRNVGMTSFHFRFLWTIYLWIPLCLLLQFSQYVDRIHAKYFSSCELLDCVCVYYVYRWGIPQLRSELQTGCVYYIII